MKQLTLTEQGRKRSKNITRARFHDIRRTVREQRRERIYKATRVANWYGIGLTTLNDVVRAKSWSHFEETKRQRNMKRYTATVPPRVIVRTDLAVPSEAEQLRIVRKGIRNTERLINVFVIIVLLLALTLFYIGAIK